MKGLFTSSDLVQETIVLESHLYRVTTSTNNMIPRFCTLSNLSLKCYQDEFKAKSQSYKPLLTLPISHVSSVERILIKHK